MNEENVADDRLTIFRCITQSPNSVREYSELFLIIDIFSRMPLDLLIDIFSRVPAKSIARFRCVSKFWAYILRRPDFKDAFLTKSLTRPRILLSFQVNKELFVFSAPQPQNPDENSCVVATRYKYLPKYFPREIHSRLCGLLFLRNQGRNGKARVICNPVTGESITLAKVKGTGMKRSYFGFDPINKEFKELCITFSVSGRPTTIHVSTLETGKRLWRTIQDPIFPHSPKDGKMCINGVLYYGAYFKGSYVIVCFDVRSEKFGFVNLDKDMPFQNGWTLFNYKGKLGAHHEYFTVLWILEDPGKHKWSKIVLPPFWYNTVHHNYKYVGITGTGEIVFSPRFVSNPSNPFYVFYYNVERKTFTRVEIKGFEEFKDQRILVSTFLDYVENMKFM